jgi:nucleoside 2-deoxyribosyltransferase
MSARGKHTQGSYFFCSLTPQGWNRVAEYQKHQKQSQKAFVAMWFDNSMNNAREQIIQAVESCGYFASIIDLKEHNNQIVSEIFYEIRHSRFVIADLTGQRGGVYYEAGYAAGLEIPVILCCRASDQTNVHFDVRQKNTIFWDDEHELRDRLIKRIHATVG